LCKLLNLLKLKEIFDNDILIFNKMLMGLVVLALFCSPREKGIDVPGKG
jgi:hypothetical protein